VKKVRTTHSTVFFSCFFTLWRKQFLGQRDIENAMKRKVNVEKHKIGRERPHFFGFQPPKKFMGSLPPCGTVIRAGPYFPR
jgi:hypothetical protein